MKNFYLAFFLILLSGNAIAQDTLHITGLSVICKDYKNPSGEYTYKSFYKTIIFEPASKLIFCDDVDEIYLASDNVIVNGPCEIIVSRKLFSRKAGKPIVFDGSKGESGYNGASLNFNFTFSKFDGPIIIYNSGTNGFQGKPGRKGSNGRNADCFNSALSGRKGGIGGDGGDGGDGGKINFSYSFSDRLYFEEASYKKLQELKGIFDNLACDHSPAISYDFIRKNDTLYTYVKLTKKSISFNEIPVLSCNCISPINVKEIVSRMDFNNLPNQTITLSGYSIFEADSVKSVVFDTTYFLFSKQSLKTRREPMIRENNIDDFLYSILLPVRLSPSKPVKYEPRVIYYSIEPGEGGSPGPGGPGGQGGAGYICGPVKHGRGDNGEPGSIGKNWGNRGKRFIPIIKKIN